ncbi:MAG: hypothetical protein AAFO06_10295 [Cyanobacteria bacterium J06597_16]
MTSIPTASNQARSDKTQPDQTQSHQTILLTGGRAPVTLDLARQFAAVGHRVLVADSLPHQLCTCSAAVDKNFVVPSPRQQTAAYITALKEIIEAEKVSWLIPTCEEVFYISAGLEQLTPLCRVFAEPLAKLEPLHNKWTFIQRVKALGLSAPKTWLIQTEADLKAALAEPEQLVLKPVYSRFASQVQIVANPGIELGIEPIKQPEQQPIEIDLKPDKPWVAQAFITGDHYCAYGVAHAGQLTAFAAYPTVFTAGAGSCIYFESIEHPGLLDWMKTFVAAEAFTGQIAFDFIESDDVLYPLECNPRAISAIHLFSKRDRLDHAFLEPDEQSLPIQPQQASTAMISLAMWLYGLPSAIATHRLGPWLKAIFTAKDVIFQWRDPLPALHMGMVLLQFIRLSVQRRQSLQRVSTQDIEWDGAPIEVSVPRLPKIDR